MEKYAINIKLREIPHFRTQRAARTDTKLTLFKPEKIGRGSVFWCGLGRPIFHYYPTELTWIEVRPMDPTSQQTHLWHLSHLVMGLPIRDFAKAIAWDWLGHTFRQSWLENHPFVSICIHFWIFQALDLHLHGIFKCNVLLSEGTGWPPPVITWLIYHCPQ